MTLIQPLLAVLLALVVAFYFARLRARLWDRLIVLVLAVACLLLVARPELANRIAHAFGVVRGVDFIFYLAIPGICFVCLLLYTRLLAMQSSITLLVREIALTRPAGLYHRDQDDTHR